MKLFSDVKQERLELAKKLGATTVINAKSDVPKELEPYGHINITIE